MVELKKRGSILQWLKQFAQNMQLQLRTLYLVSRHPELPRPAKLMALMVIGYALSPIDLIPDFIPVIGYLDDLLLLPLGIYLTIRLIPQPLWFACQQQINAAPKDLPVSKVAAACILTIWLLFSGALGFALWHYFILS